MPSRLRPKAPVAADAILVGDPARALLLAQELLEQPKMSNHARGLWGYSGQTPAGRELTIQATGMGGPSAAAVLVDLTKLGVKRAIRVGTCVGLTPAAPLGALLTVTEALAAAGSATSLGLAPGEAVQPDPNLRQGLEDALGDRAKGAVVGSFDEMPPGPEIELGEIAAADMQTVAVLARGRQLRIGTAAVLVVGQTSGDERLADERLATAAKALGQAASSTFREG